MRFKIGDKVKVIKVLDNKDLRYYKIGFTGTITDKFTFDYLVKFDKETEFVKSTPGQTDNEWYCGDTELELVKEEKEIFTWDKFLKGEIVVQCDTEEKWDNFLHKCYRRGINWHWGRENVGENVVRFDNYVKCVRFNEDENGLLRSGTEFYIDMGYTPIKWKIEQKTKSQPIKTDITYLILDASGSINQQKKDEYKKIYDKLISESKCVKVITHTTVAKFDDIEFKAMDGGTYLSSGLGLATTDIIARGYNKQGKTIKVVQATDGDNWSEDNERTFNMVNNLLDNGVDYEYYEIDPSTYSTTMYYRFEKEIPALKDNNKLNIVRTTPVFKTNIYEVEHRVGQKLYDFVNSFKDVKIGDCVLCDTSHGYTYGRVKNIRQVTLTQVQINSYKECKKVV